MRLSVIIPAFNEDKTIRGVVLKVLRQKVVSEVIVVDDGSADNTYQVVKNINNPKLKILRHKINQGKGASIRSGLYKISGDYVIIQDADLEYNPAEYGKLLKHMTPNTAVYGSRILAKNKHAYARTYLGNVLVTLIFNILYGTRLTDIYTCYKLMPANVAKRLKISSFGFEVEAEISAKLVKREIKILEVPISYQPRKYQEGKKIKAKDALLGVRTFLKLRFENDVIN